jgi:nucleoside-diphosphate-sugar epimerase
MKHILISGGAGYLGTALTQFLLKKNKITVYDAFYFPWLKTNKKKIKNRNRLFFIKKDLTKVKLKDFKNIDLVCDLNGISNDPASEINPRFTWDINYKKRLNFAKIAKEAGVKRYIFNSTCSVYGYNKNKVDENSRLNPISTYAKANLKSEKEIFNLRNNNFKVNILRNSTLFGFSNVMRLDLVINIFAYNLLKNEKIVIDGNGRQYRPFISINDVCKIYDFLIDRDKLPSFICNLVAFNSTIKNIATAILKISKKKGKIFFDNKSRDKRNYYVISKNFKKYFSRDFKFTNFSKEVISLLKLMKEFKIKLNNQTVRIKFYKKLFEFNN